MNSEYMGLFGLSWQEKVVARMRKIVSADLKKDVTLNLVNSLYSVYMVSGNKNVTADEMAEKTGIDNEMSTAFLMALKDAALKGEIAYRYYDPGTVQAAEKKKADLLTPQPVKDLKKYATVAAVLTGGFLAIKLLSLNPFKR